MISFEDLQAIEERYSGGWTYDYVRHEGVQYLSVGGDHLDPDLIIRAPDDIDTLAGEVRRLVDENVRLHHHNVEVEDLLVAISGPGVTAEEFRAAYFNADGTVRANRPESIYEKVARLEAEIERLSAHPPKETDARTHT